MNSRYKSLRFWLITWSIYNSSLFAFIPMLADRTSLLDMGEWFVKVYFLVGIGILVAEAKDQLGDVFIFFLIVANVIAIIMFLPFTFWSDWPSIFTAYFLALAGSITGPVIPLWLELPEKERPLCPLVLALEYFLFWLFNWWRRKYYPNWKIPLLDKPLAG